MKNHISRLIACAAVAFPIVLLTGCSADTPFDTTEGEGTLHMAVTVSHSVTRAIDEAEQSKLENTCKIQLTNLGKGKISNQFTGISNVPEKINLSTGDYRAEVWAGDSVPASLNKKFYAGKTDFEIKAGENTQISINCKIRNVAVALNCSEITADPALTECTITVGHTGGTVTFSKDATGEDEANLITTLEGHANFMMPNGCTTLTYTISGTYAGKKFEQPGVIEGVEAAHQYNLELKYGEKKDPTTGGGIITIDVDYDGNEIVSGEDDNTIFVSPLITGVSGFDITADYTPQANDNGFTVKALCYQSILSLTLKAKDADYFGFDKEYDLTDAEDLKTLSEKGITVSRGQNTTNVNGTDYEFAKAYVSFSKSFIDGLRTLTDSESAKTLTISATDELGNTTSETLKINKK